MSRFILMYRSSAISVFTFVPTVLIAVRSRIIDSVISGMWCIICMSFCAFHMSKLAAFSETFTLGERTPTHFRMKFLTTRNTSQSTTKAMLDYFRAYYWMKIVTTFPTNSEFAFIFFIKWTDFIFILTFLFFWFCAFGNSFSIYINDTFFYISFFRRRFSCCNLFLFRLFLESL